MRELGPFRGTIVAVWRVLRCNPLSPGGIDPLEARRLFRSGGTEHPRPAPARRTDAPTRRHCPHLHAIPEAIVKVFYDVFGNWGVAIILLTFTVRLAILPLSLKQIRSMRALQELQPELKAIQDEVQGRQAAPAAGDDEVLPGERDQSARLLLPPAPAAAGLLRPLRDAPERQLPERRRASANTGFLFIDNITQPPETTAIAIVLVVLFVGTQLLAGLAMSVRGQLEGPQRFIVFGLPFAFAPFVFQFPTGLAIYWITTNVWTFGQQQVVGHFIPPPEKKTPEEIAAGKPPPPPPKKKKKRSGKRR